MDLHAEWLMHASCAPVIRLFKRDEPNVRIHATHVEQVSHLGEGYRELGDNTGVFRSADGLRQFRIDGKSLTGGHWPHHPHVHFEVFQNPGDKRQLVNNHVPLRD